MKGITPSDHLPKAPSPNIITLGIWISVYGFGEDTGYGRPFLLAVPWFLEIIKGVSLVHDNKAELFVYVDGGEREKENLVIRIISPHLCHILLVRSKSQVLPTRKQRGLRVP